MSSATSGNATDLSCDQALEDSAHAELQTSYWDWASLADDEGYVDVILIDGEEGQTGPPSKVSDSGLFRSLAALEPTAMVESPDKVIKREYSRVFNGMAARLSVASILALESQDHLVQIYPDIEIRTMVGENIQQVGADHVWTLDDPSGDPVIGSGIVVAVVDTGVDYTHPDLGGGFGPGYKVIGGYDFVNNDGDPLDDHGHGTHVAGIVAASGGISGVAPGADILAFKVLDGNGYGSMSDVIAGIEAAMDPDGDGSTSDHADVISLSLGGAGEPNDPLCQAVSSAVGAGVVVVVAAGNEGPGMDTVASPGLEPSAVTVGAIDSDGFLADFSSRGTSQELLMKPEVSAPGVSITSTVPYSGTPFSSSTGYMSMSGTSMATPHVSGVAALLLQLHPDWTPEQVKSAIITGSGLIDEPFWHAGAGALWAPSAAEMSLFFSEPILRALVPDGTSISITILNDGAAASFALDTSDCHSVWYDGSASEAYWTNASAASPSSLTIPAGGTGVAEIAVVAPPEPNPEGYYDGTLWLTASGRSMRVPFGFVVLSELNVHVLNTLDVEFSDPRGVSFVFGYPDASVAQLEEGTPTTSCPPASFKVPSGTYSAHALGHQVFYSFSDPYMLSGIVEVGRLQTVDLYLRMADARVFTIDLATDDGNPIFVKDFLMYCRYDGDFNVSAQAVASDRSVIGSDVFSLPKSRNVYVSDTSATVGISVAGFSYSADMWDFMSRNWDHWYEYSDSASTDFLVESSADLQYLMSWEFDGVDSTSAQELGLDPSVCSVFDTKYDVIGAIDSVWGSGTHLSIGGDATPYIRRSTYTSLNPFFSGMTRTTYVQGVYYELYWPGTLSEAYVSPEYYIPDYSHRVKAIDVEDVYLPDRIYLNSIEGVSKSVRVGAGPFYPSIRTMNDASNFVILHPLLRDQGGTRVASPETPWLYLYRNGAVVYSSDLAEHLGNPDPMRVVPISSGGNYRAIFPTMNLASDISSTVKIILGFSTRTADMNPPTVTGLLMPQRFVPGESIYLELSATDDVALGSADIQWRSSGSLAWQSLTVDDLGSGVYGATISTATSDAGIDLMFNVSDTTGNYIEYATTDASLRQVPIVFDLSTDSSDVSYVDGDVTVVLSGHLTDSDGNPLSSECAVPIDLMLNGRKVAMVLDEYVVSGSHTHNGLIRFEWHLNPARLFTGADETIGIRADVDLGIYEPVSDTIYLHSVRVGNSAPVIRLVSPSDGSMIAAGQVIDLSLWDDGEFDADAYLDGAFLCHLSSPWDIETSSWAEGSHVLKVVATDAEGLVTTATYDFGIDAFAPSVIILYPGESAHIPQGSLLSAQVTDSYLSGVWYSVDGQPAVTFAAPYEIDMTGWVPGSHTVEISANDIVGHFTSESVTFTITSGSIVVDVLSPQNGSVVRSGVPIVVSVTGDGVITAKWTEDGAWLDLASDGIIPTTGWSEGSHQVTINATNDYSEFDEYILSIVIDDTQPEITLESPGDNSYVDMSDEIVLRIADANLLSTTYALWGLTSTSTAAGITIPLSSSPDEGTFELSVSSVDMAGNSMDASFSFTMDLSPPEVSADGFTSGDAIAQGQIIGVTAADLFLSAVQCSLDDGSFQMLEFPYEVRTDGLSGGWHDIVLVASDYSGKQSYLNLTLYVDVIAPVVQVTRLEPTDLDNSLDVTATISDDYAVAEATLYYEASDGSYCTIAMMFNGTGYVAELTADLLWDGMTVYVVAEDTVGNQCQSAQVTLSEVVVPDKSGDDTFADVPSSGLWYDSWGGLLALGVIVASSVLGFALMTRRRRSATKKTHGRPVASGPMRESIRAAPRSAVPPVKVTSVPVVRAVSAPSHSLRPCQAAAGPPERETGRRSVVDAIPELVIMPVGAPTEDSADDTDRGEMVELELNLSALKRSGLRDEAREGDVDREPESLFGGPQIVSGLMLKRFMDVDRQKT